MKEQLLKIYKDTGIVTFVIVIISMALIFVGLECLYISIGAYLWNIIAVLMLGLPTITFWQFFGLHILITMLMPRYSYNKGEKN